MRRQEGRGRDRRGIGRVRTKERIGERREKTGGESKSR